MILEELLIGKLVYYIKFNLHESILIIIPEFFKSK